MTGGGTVAIPSLCHLCQQPTTMSCSMCGRPVCPDHIERFSRMCVTCLMPRGRPPHGPAQ